MTAPQLTESLSDRLTALKRPLPPGVITRAQARAAMATPSVVRTVASTRGRMDAENALQAPSNLGPVIDRRRRGVLNVIAAVAAIAVITAGVAAFGLELSGHLRNAQQTPAHAQRALATLPVVGASGLPISAHIVVPATRGRGSTLLSSFITERALYMQYDCAGTGTLEIRSTDHAFSDDVLSCPKSSEPITVAVSEPETGSPLTLQVVAATSMTWELVVAESNLAGAFPSLSPWLPESVLPLLVGDTYATGSTSLPTFVPTKPYWIQYACMGMTAISFASSDGSVDYTSESCNQSPGINGLFVPENQVIGQPVSLRVTTRPLTEWEVRVVQFSGHAPQPYEIVPPTPVPGHQVNPVTLIPDTHGEGSVTLPTFTPTTLYYNSVLSCSGPGSLEITASDGSTFTQESCEGGRTGSGAGGEDQPGVPISLVIKADPGTTWEIIVYGVNAELPQP
jgi:hypothetical protein